MPKVEIGRLPRFDGPNRVSALLGPLGAYEGRAISAAHGLEHLGANIETLMPGAASSHRHWHESVDEIVVVLSGVLTLVETESELRMAPGEIAVFPAGVANGHCLRNESDGPATFLVVASRDAEDRCHYAEADLIATPDGSLRRSDGTIVAKARK